MQIPRTNILLDLVVKHSNYGVIKIDAYGSNVDRLPTVQMVKGDLETIRISVKIPERVILSLTGNSDSGPEFVEPLSLTIAGIKVKKDLMPRVLDYKPSHKPDSVSNYLNNGSVISNTWGHNGCVLINLFNPNPIAYHMYIGNQIIF